MVYFQVNSNPAATHSVSQRSANHAAPEVEGPWIKAEINQLIEPESLQCARACAGLDLVCVTVSLCWVREMVGTGTVAVEVALKNQASGAHLEGPTAELV